jgi:hypothetical protein
MDIKRKTCDIRTWKKHLFLDLSSTNIDIQGVFIKLDALKALHAQPAAKRTRILPMT